MVLLFCAVPTVYAPINKYVKKPIKNAFIGTWTLVSVDNIYPDGHREHRYGDNPNGLLIFDLNGNYAIQILNSKRDSILSVDKNKITAEENVKLVQSSNSHFGKYEVDEKTHIITFKIKYAFFSNWKGTVQKTQLYL